MFKLQIPNREITRLLPRAVTDYVTQSVFHSFGYELADASQLSYSQFRIIEQRGEEFVTLVVDAPVQAVVKGVWVGDSDIMLFHLTSIEYSNTTDPPIKSIGSAIESHHVTDETADNVTPLMRALRQNGEVPAPERPAPASRETRSIMFNNQ